MNKNNCLDCLFADITSVTIMMLDLTNEDSRICEHPNSPMHKRYVNDNKCCKFYVDEKEYFCNKDRKDKIDKLKDKSNFNRP
jgi:hypothetical protein